MTSSYPIIGTEPHFLTFTVVGWKDVFSRQAYRDFLLENLDFCRREKGLRIHAYVIMSNHMHLILSGTDRPLHDIIGEYKRYTALHLVKMIAQENESRREWMLPYFREQAAHNSRNTKNQFWKQDNHAELLYSRQFTEQKLSYIHENPVRAGIVAQADQYLYSSAGSYAGKKGFIEIDYIFG